MTLRAGRPNRRTGNGLLHRLILPSDETTCDGIAEADSIWIDALSPINEANRPPRDLKWRQNRTAIFGKAALALGGLGQVFLSTFVVLAILQYPTALASLTMLILIDAESIRVLQMQSLGIFVVFLVFAILNMISMIGVNRDNKGRRAGIIGALLGLVTAAAGAIYFTLQLSDISLTIFGFQGISLYGTTIFAAATQSIAGPVLGLTMLLIGKFFSANQGQFKRVGPSRFVAAGYAIAAALELAAILLGVVSVILGLNFYPALQMIGVLVLHLALASFLMIIAVGILGAVSFFKGMRTD